ncbi:MAG: Ig-like domain-containing protein, partial [Planctomycetota bacterium]
GINVKAHVTGGPVFSLEDLFTTSGDFDGSLGFLAAGQIIYVGVGSNSNAGGDATTWNYSIIKVDDTSNGSLIVGVDGNISYPPNPGFGGIDAFDYEITDGRGGRDSATVIIDVEAPDVPINIEQLDVLKGALAGGDLPDLVDSDESYVQILSANARPFFENSIEVELVATSPNLNPNTLTFCFESRVSTPNIFQKIDVFNHQTGLYETVDTGSASITDQIINVSLSGNLQRFIDQNTGQLRSRVSLAVIGPVIGSPWSYYIDEASWK